MKSTLWQQIRLDFLLLFLMLLLLHDTTGSNGNGNGNGNDRPPPPPPPPTTSYGYPDSVHEGERVLQQPQLQLELELEPQPQLEPQPDYSSSSPPGHPRPRPGPSPGPGPGSPPPPPRRFQAVQETATHSNSQTTTLPKSPIHYEFPMASTLQDPLLEDDVDATMDPDPSTPLSSSTSLSSPLRASPRHDFITRYMSTTSGKLQVHFTSTVLGGGMGIVLGKASCCCCSVVVAAVGGRFLCFLGFLGFLGCIRGFSPSSILISILILKALLPFGTWVWGGIGASFWLFASLFSRSPLGELIRAMALSLVLVLQRTRQIRHKYPTWRYVPGALFQYTGRERERGREREPGRGSRQDRYRTPPPFPPARNPWNYTPRRPNDVEFNMVYTILAMAMVGSTCGGNLPMIPAWMGSLAGAATFALGCTLTNSPRGDLCRTMGMRVVAMVQELWDIQAQLSIVPKAAMVSSQLIDRLLILDRQHKVKDRFLNVVNTGYEQVLKTASRVQEQRLDAQGRGEQRPVEGDDEEEDRLRPLGRDRAEPYGRRPRPMDRRGDPREDGRDEEFQFENGSPPGGHRRRRRPSPPSRMRESDDPTDRDWPLDEERTLDTGRTKRRWFGR